MKFNLNYYLRAMREVNDTKEYCRQYNLDFTKNGKNYFQLLEYLNQHSTILNMVDNSDKF